MRTLAQPPANDDARTAALICLLDEYKAEFELMCIQFLAGGTRLAIRDSVMALYRVREHLPAAAREQIDALLITDGDAVRAMLELANARGAAKLHACESQMRRQRQRHTELVHQLHGLLMHHGG